MPVIVEFNRVTVTELTGPGGQVTQRWLRLLADIDRRAKMKLSGQMVEVRTGTLRSSQQPPFIQGGTGGRIVGVVQNVAEYALYVHEGTRAHEIKAAAGKVLTGWQYDGAQAFAPSVHHPGTAARPFLRDAAREAMAAFR